MYPVLFTLGPISINTLNVFLALAFLVSSFIFWKRGREEHYKEELIFDGFLLSGIVGVIFARIGFVVLHAGDFGLAINKWFDVLSYPGLSGTVGLVAMGLYLYRFAKNHKWDAFEILDFWSGAMALGLAVLQVGLFFDGGGSGLPTQLPIGVVFPGNFEARHPVQLYFAVFYLLLFIYLQWAEFNYRTFEWYRSGKKTAQTGFLISIAMISSGIVQVGLSFLKIPTAEFFGVNIDQATGLLLFIAGLVLLYVRSGRELPILKRRRYAKVERLGR